jgi:hypothetical protein
MAITIPIPTWIRGGSAGLRKTALYDAFDVENRLWRSVRRANVEYSGADVRKDAFKKWCIPFDEGHYEVLGRIIVTKDEHWQITPKWLTDHNLPMLIGAGITALPR